MHVIGDKMEASVFALRCLVMSCFVCVVVTSKLRHWLGENTVVQGGYPEARSSGCLLVELNGFLYVFGGSSNSGDNTHLLTNIYRNDIIDNCCTGSLLNDLHRFDSSSLTWTDFSGLVIGPVPPPREYHGVATVGGLLYVFGGTGDTGTSIFALLSSTAHLKSQQGAISTICFSSIQDL